MYILLLLLYLRSSVQIRRGVLCFARSGKLINKPYDVRTRRRFGNDGFGARRESRSRANRSGRQVGQIGMVFFSFDPVVGIVESAQPVEVSGRSNVESATCSGCPHLEHRSSPVGQKHTSRSLYSYVIRKTLIGHDHRWSVIENRGLI